MADTIMDPEVLKARIAELEDSATALTDGLERITPEGRLWFDGWNVELQERAERAEARVAELDAFLNETVAALVAALVARAEDEAFRAGALAARKADRDACDECREILDALPLPARIRRTSLPTPLPVASRCETCGEPWSVCPHPAPLPARRGGR